MQNFWTFTYSCPDVAGVQSAVSTFIYEQGGFIEESRAHSEHESNRFYSRIVFRTSEQNAITEQDFEAGFKSIADKFEIKSQLNKAETKIPTVIAVSKFGHCLNDLLHRWKGGDLPIDIKAIVSNHENMREMAEWYGLPYHYIPVTKDTKPEAEAQFYKTVTDYGAELVVLARYMQILSDDLSAKLSGKCINIHHSFLPSFKGAKPYHQAHQRGVKIIGATAHYVTADLDEGPIIEQDVERIDHSYTADELVEIGRDIEARVLARAVKWHASKRVIMNGGNKTIVFK